MSIQRIEHLVSSICGEKWKSEETDGGWGVAIVRAVLDGASPEISKVASYLEVHSIETIRPAFTRLELNGVFLRNRIANDRKALNNNDVHAWCQYAGLASGATGYVQWEPRKRKES